MRPSLATDAVLLGPAKDRGAMLLSLAACGRSELYGKLTG